MKVQHPKELEQLYTIKFGTNIRYVSFEINILCPVLCFNHSQMGSKPISRESCCIYCLGVVFTSLFIDTCLFFLFCSGKPFWLWFFPWGSTLGRCALRLPNFADRKFMFDWSCASRCMLGAAIPTRTAASLTPTTSVLLTLLITGIKTSFSISEREQTAWKSETRFLWVLRPFFFFYSRC